MTNTDPAPENQLDLFPATEDDFEYLIKYKYWTTTNWHPILLQNEHFFCVWWNCENLNINPKSQIKHYEIKSNPNYKGNKVKQMD